jgi:tetratricopeptide (TPR) repeat protein
MRLALVIAPPQPEAGPASTPIASSLASRLQAGGFQVTKVALSVDFSRDVSRALAAASRGGDSLLVYLGGAMKLGEDGAPLVRVAEGSLAVYAVDALGRLVKGCQPREVLYVVDVVHEGEDDAFLAAEYVDAVVRALRVREDGFGCLVGASATPREGQAPAWEFTSLLLRALDDPAVLDERRAAPLSRVLERERALAEGGARVPSFAHIRGATDFAILEPAGESPTPGPVSGPALDTILARASDAKARSAWDEALDSYKMALMVHGARTGEPRANVYAAIAEVKLAQGKAREAELNFEKALEAHPGHSSSFRALLELAEGASDWRRVVAVRSKMRAALGDVSQLVTVADILDEKLHDARGALDALEAARGGAAGDVALLGRIRTIYERMQRWPQVVDVLGDLCRETSDPKARGELRFVQADIALARLRDEPRGLSFLDAALEEDPAHEKALQALVVVRERRHEWPALERAFARLIDRHAERGDVERAWDMCKRLGVLRRDQIGDPASAMEAFAGALRCKPLDVESRAAVADLMMTRGDLEHAKSELQSMAAQAPTRVATFRKLFELHTRTAEVDRAWLVATALEELQAADMDHQLLIDQFRPEPTSAARPASSVDDDAWDTLLHAPGADRTVAAILRAVAKAAVATRVRALKASKKLFSLRPERKQSPTSTVSVVRTFVWASQILNVPLPELYVYDDVPGGLAAVPGEAMTTAIGPAVLSGLPLRELSFVVGRHLAYYRPEHHLLVFFPSLAELSTLFLAAASIALPKLEATPAASKLRASLEKNLQPAERQELAVAVTHFDAAGGKVDLASWIRSVELTATRAGMLLAGDIAIAMRVLNRETRSIADVSLQDKRADLLACCASAGFGTLRKRLGIAAKITAEPAPDSRATPPV